MRFGLAAVAVYTTYEDPRVVFQNNRKLVEFDRKLEGSQSKFYSNFERVMMH